LKGVAGSIGALALQTAGADLEAALKEQPDALPEMLVEEARTQLEQTIAAIRSIAAVPAEGAMPGGDSATSADVVPNLHGLLEKLEQYDSEADDVLEEILGQVAGTPMADPLRALKKRVGQYDFEGAAEDLKRLVASLDESADEISSRPVTGSD
jgi:two-component system sensor histidine kinase/response regulator